MGILGKLWQGQYPLMMIFWGLYVAGWFVVLIVSMVTVQVMASIPVPAKGLAFGASVFAYVILSSIIVVRTAINQMRTPSNDKTFPAAAIAVVVVFGLLWTLLVVFLVYAYSVQGRCTGDFPHAACPPRPGVVK